MSTHRLLPFKGDDPSAWEYWEKFWLDLLNSKPRFPWPKDKRIWKTVLTTERYGPPGSTQDGIDLRATMDDGNTLAIQCKNKKSMGPTDAERIMDKASTEYAADAYLLVTTLARISPKTKKSADQRGDWFVIDREELSSWFFADRIVPRERQKELVKQYLGEAELRRLFPIISDDLLIHRERFLERFQRKNSLISHDQKLIGEKANAAVENCISKLQDVSTRAVIVVAPGGTGKTRILLEIADRLGSENTKALFFNEHADSEAEAYSLRGSELNDVVVLIDDAHRIGNLRPRLLTAVLQSPGSKVVIASRPNAVESARSELFNLGFASSEVSSVKIESLETNDLYEIALALLGTPRKREAHWLASKAEGCTLLVTVGARLLSQGASPQELLNRSDFKRIVFDRLLDAALHSALPTSETVKLAQGREILGLIALLGPVRIDFQDYDANSIASRASALFKIQPWEFENTIRLFKNSGVVTKSSAGYRVVPDMLADHLVYEAAYGSTRQDALVDCAIKEFGSAAFTTIFANLAEAEWRARQEGKAGSYLDPLWDRIKDAFDSGNATWLREVAHAWGRFAVFVPERTIQFAGMIRDRGARDAPRVEDWSIDEHDDWKLWKKLPELLKPVACYIESDRTKALELLFEAGLGDVGEGFPETWGTIAEAASLRYWPWKGPHALFVWVKNKFIAPSSGFGEKRLVELAIRTIGALFESEYEGRRVVMVRSQIKNAPLVTFRSDALDWLESMVFDGNIPAHAAIGILSKADSLWPVDHSHQEFKACESIGEKSLTIMHRLIERDPSPVLHYLIWSHLSRELAETEGGVLRRKQQALRDIINKNGDFQLVRIVTSYAHPEWGSEHLKSRGEYDYDEVSRWWGETAHDAVAALRNDHKTVARALEQLATLAESLSSANRTADWHVLADAWIKGFPDDREEVCSYLFGNPSHPIISQIGWFALPWTTTAQSAPDVRHALIIQALRHNDIRVVRPAVMRFSYNDAPFDQEIAAEIKELSRSSDLEKVRLMADFIGAGLNGPPLYHKTVLTSLNYAVLDTADLDGLLHSLSNAIEHQGAQIASQDVRGLFTRLAEIEHFGDVGHSNDLAIMHRHFPAEFCETYIARLLAWKWLPAIIRAAPLTTLKSKPEHERLSRKILSIALDPNHKRYPDMIGVAGLYDATVNQVDPPLSAKLLAESMDKSNLETIVELTGCGNGSLVYDEPAFARELLRQIDQQPLEEAKNLRWNLIWKAVPHQRGWTAGELDANYTWARKLATERAETYREDPLLFEFFQSIVRFEDEDEWRQRERYVDDLE
jgi:hypothetical protein